MAFLRRLLPVCALALAAAGLAAGDSAAVGVSDLELGETKQDLQIQLGESKETDMTTPRHDDMTTPGPPPTTGSIAGHLKDIVEHQLRSSHHQWINASIALVFGLVMVFDGQMVFKWILVAAAFLVACVVAMSDLNAEWASEDGHLLRHIAGLEVGLVAAYAAWRGFEGLVIIVGALLGAAVGYFLQGYFVSMHMGVFATSGPAIMSLYSVCIIAGVLAFRFKRHAKALAILSSLVGSALVASAIAWSITFAAIKKNLFDDLTPKGGAWLDFFNLLWNPKTEDVGLLAGSPYNLELRGTEWRTDRIGEVALASLFFVAGVAVQFSRLKASTTAPAQDKKLRAREPSLREALLSEA